MSKRKKIILLIAALVVLVAIIIGLLYFLLGYLPQKKRIEELVLAAEEYLLQKCFTTSANMQSTCHQSKLKKIINETGLAHR